MFRITGIYADGQLETGESQYETLAEANDAVEIAAKTFEIYSLVLPQKVRDNLIPVALFVWEAPDEV